MDDVENLCGRTDSDEECGRPAVLVVVRRDPHPDGPYSGVRPGDYLCGDCQTGFERRGGVTTPLVP